MKMQYSQSNLVNYNSVFMIHFQFPFLTTCTTNIFQVKTVDIIKLFFYSIGINIEKVSYIEQKSIFTFSGCTFQIFDLSCKCTAMSVTMVHVIQPPNIINGLLFLLNSTTIKTTFFQLILIKLTGFLLHHNNIDFLVFASNMNSVGTSFTTNGSK